MREHAKRPDLVLALILVLLFFSESRACNNGFPMAVLYTNDMPLHAKIFFLAGITPEIHTSHNDAWQAIRRVSRCLAAHMPSLSHHKVSIPEEGKCSMRFGRPVVVPI